jgi:hypothetical protein
VTVGCVPLFVPLPTVVSRGVSGSETRISPFFGAHRGWSWRRRLSASRRSGGSCGRYAVFACRSLTLRAESDRLHPSNRSLSNLRVYPPGTSAWKVDGRVPIEERCRLQVEPV